MASVSRDGRAAEPIRRLTKARELGLASDIKLSKYTEITNELEHAIPLRRRPARGLAHK